MSNNAKISAALRQIAALLAEQGVLFKPAAYRRAAQMIEELPRDVSTYGDAKELKKLPGIGDAIAGKIVEYLETGQIALLSKLRMEQGGIAQEILDIEDLGPKRARALQSALGVTTVAEVKKAAEEERIRDLPGFDAILEAKILENTGRVAERTKRSAREEVRDEVEALLAAITAVKGVDRAAVAGSFRREKDTVGDIDILVTTKKPAAVSDAIAALPMVRDVVAHGEKKLSFNLQSGLRTDVRFVVRDAWGSALMYFTGSKEHNIAVRKVAIAKGWKLSEYGLFDGEDVVASREEEDIYEALGLRYYEPKERESGVL